MFSRELLTEGLWSEASVDRLRERQCLVGVEHNEWGEGIIACPTLCGGRHHGCALHHLGHIVDRKSLYVSVLTKFLYHNCCQFSLQSTAGYDTHGYGVQEE